MMEILSLIFRLFRLFNNLESVLQEYRLCLVNAHDSAAAEDAEITAAAAHRD